jgi:hypothetical protein
VSRRDRYKDAANRRERGQFAPLPYVCLRSAEFAALSPYAVKLLFDLLAQFNGANNGDLCAAWKLMRPRGWRSKGTLAKAVRELRDTDWLEVTRQGGRNRPTLYALTFYAIDACSGKLEVSATVTPPGTWRKTVPPMPNMVPTHLPKSAEVRAALGTEKLKSLPRHVGQSVGN